MSLHMSDPYTNTHCKHDRAFRYWNGAGKPFASFLLPSRFPLKGSGILLLGVLVGLIELLIPNAGG